MTTSVRIDRGGAVRSSTAFTLVELLVVIAVLGVLGSLLLTSVRKAMNRARTTGCISNLRQWGFAHSMYVMDHGMTAQYQLLPGGWYAQIGIYMARMTQARFCPVTREDAIRRQTLERRAQGTADMPYNNSVPATSPIVGVTLPQSITRYVGSYGFNNWLTSTVYTDPPLRNMPFLNESNIRFTELTPVFADGFHATPFVQEVQVPGRDLYAPGIYEGPGINMYTLARHGGAGPARSSLPVAPGESLGPYVNNFAFADGHVSQVKLDNLWKLYWHKTWIPPVRRPR